VTRIDVPEQQGVFLFEVRRSQRGPLLVIWRQADSFADEDEPPLAVGWPWPASYAEAVDAFGWKQPLELHDGRVQLEVSITPLFVTAG
jgi:hypothetical protein